jgi:membrane-bound serine protease (ClpP class)
MALVLTLLIAGVILLALETVLPGLIAGIAGAICLIAGVVLAYTELGPLAGNTTLILVITLFLAGVIIWFRFFPRSWLGRRFVSKGEVGSLGVEQPELLHQTGTTLTTLRPSGTALINGRRIDVVTEGALVERGSPVRVVAVEGMRIVVRPTDRAMGGPQDRQG